MNIHQLRNTLTTSCRGCNFRALDSYGQVGCLAHDVSNESYTVEDNCFKFDSKICQFKREVEWVYPEESIENQISRVRKEVTMRYMVASYCTSVEEAETAYKHIDHQTLKPKQIVLYFENSKDSTALLDKIQNGKSTIKNPTNGIKWSVLTQAVDNFSYDDVLRSFPNIPFYCFINAKQAKEIEFSYFNWLDKQINDYGFRFRMIGGDIKIISSMVYKSNILPLDEIEEQLQEQGIAYYDFRDLYNNYLEFRNWSKGDDRFIY